MNNNTVESVISSKYQNLNQLYMKCTCQLVVLLRKKTFVDLFLVRLSANEVMK